MENYLEVEVRSATPQRLRQLLIDGAIRFALTSKHRYQQNEIALADAAAGRCVAILAELFDSIEGSEPILDQMRSVHAIALTQFLEEQKTDPIAALDQLIQVLEIERDTWSALVEMHPELPVANDAASATQADLTPSDAAKILAEKNEAQKDAFEGEPKRNSFVFDA